MDSRNIKNRLEAYGADMRGIVSRFLDDMELYEKCFLEFLVDPNVSKLEASIREENYCAAFDAAHALKGISGNLGLTPYYEAIFKLVESLRAKNYRNVAEEYEKVNVEFCKLYGLLSQFNSSDDGNATDEDEKQDEPSDKNEKFSDPSSILKQFNIKSNKKQNPKRSAKKKKIDTFIVSVVACLLVAVVLVSGLFAIIIKNFRTNISMESAGHLTEICYQLKLSIENKFDSHWKTALSIGEWLDDNAIDSDEKLVKFLKNQRDNWDYSDLAVYNEAGKSVNSFGTVLEGSSVVNLISGVAADNEYVNVANSKLTYAVKIDKNVTYDGSKITALSVTQDLGDFIDNIGFNVFDGAGYLYLTKTDGVVLSKLTHNSATPVENVKELFASARIISAQNDGLTVDDMFKYNESVVYLMRADGAKSKDKQYVVSTPVFAHSFSARLLLIVPEQDVNSNLNRFSYYVIWLSFGVIMMFAAAAVFVFLFIYALRKREFDKKISTRERMLNMLIKNTNTAFGLFHVNENQPIFVSDNVEQLIGEKYILLNKEGSIYSMTNSSGVKTEEISLINERMRNWDGMGAFRSGFIRNTASDSELYYEIQLFPTGNEDEYVAIAQDVTQTYDRENAAKDALDMAERANSAKSSFLSNMSHDIRTPMNAIVNMTNFAMESLEDKQQLAEYLQTIRESSNHLLMLINDILDMSRIESGQIVVESTPFSIKDEIAKLIDMVRPLCGAKSQHFTADYDTIQADGVIGDQNKFSQIIMNVLSNAVKFTPEHGTVRLTAVEIPSLKEDFVNLRFTIEDNGMGMTPETLERIFEPFNRADNKRVSKIEGTGLGLSICRSYVHAMGGTITCESEYGFGSTFTVELFFQKADKEIEEVKEEETERAVEAAQDSLPFSSKHCLLCEDNAINQTIATKILEHLGFSVEVASNGDDGVKKFTASKAGHFDVIYMDIQMPILDGYQATAAIRESGHPQAHNIPIIAMTANVFAEDIEKARSAGMDGHVGKPILRDELVEVTLKALQNRK